MAECVIPHRESYMAESSITIPKEEILMAESFKITPKLGGIGVRSRKFDVSLHTKEPAQPLEVRIAVGSNAGDGADESSANVEEAKKILKNYADACDKSILKFSRLLQNLGLAIWAFVGLVLSGFGTFLSAPVFWVCFVLLFYDALARYIIRPFATQGWARDSRVDTLSGCFKLLPTLALLVLLRVTPFTTSDQCTQGSVCYSRLRESLWAIVGTSLLEVLPTMFMLGISDNTAKNLWRILFRLKMLYLLFMKLAVKSKATYIQITSRPEEKPEIEQKQGPRRREIHILMSTLGDVNPSFLDRSRGYHPTDDIKTDVDESFSMFSMVSLSWVQSTVSVILVLTVSLLVGGSFGTFMTRKAYWICYCSVFVELLAESIFGERMKIVCTKSVGDESDHGESIGSSCRDIKVKKSRKPFILSPVFRFCAQAPLFGLMLCLLRTGGYFSLDSSGCDATCQNRGKELFYVACVSAGLQCIAYPALCITWPIALVMQLYIPSFVLWGGSVALVNFVVYFLGVLVVPFVALISLLLYFGVFSIILVVGALVDRITGKSFCGTWLGLS